MVRSPPSFNNVLDALDSEIKLEKEIKVTGSPHFVCIVPICINFSYNNLIAKISLPQ